jgi:hypothetical protein
MDGLTKNISFSMGNTTMDRQGIPLEHMKVSELLDLKHKIEGYLPALALKDVNLETELLQQFAVLKELQSDTLQDLEAMPNQKAQVAGQIANILKQLVELQSSLSREEEFKRMEQALLEAVTIMPDDAKDKFFAEYTVLARNSGVK